MQVVEFWAQNHHHCLYGFGKKFPTRKVWFCVTSLELFQVTGSMLYDGMAFGSEVSKPPYFIQFWVEAACIKLFGRSVQWYHYSTSRTFYCECGNVHFIHLWKLKPLVPPLTTQGCWGGAAQVWSIEDRLVLSTKHSWHSSYPSPYLARWWSSFYDPPGRKSF